MSLLWSPSAENACDSLMTVSRMLAPWPRRLSAAVLMNAPSVLTPPGSVGCSSSASFSSCSRKVVPLHRNRGAFARDDRVVGHHRPAGVDRGQLNGARGHQRRRQDHGLGVRRHLVLAVVPERDLDPVGLRLDLVDLADGHTEDANVVTDVDAVAVVEVGDDIRAVDGVGGSEQHGRAGDEQHDKGDGRPSSCECGSSSGLPACGWRHLTRRGHHHGARRRHRCGVQPGWRQRGRPRRRAARRRRGQRLAVRVAAGGAGQRHAGRTAPRLAGIAGDRVGQIQMRLAALAGARERHRQRGCPWLADLRVGALRRQQTCWDPGRGRRRRRRRTAARTGRAAGWRCRP